MEFNFIKIFGGGKTLVDVGLFVPDSVDKILLALSSAEQSKENVQEGFGPWLEAARDENCLIIAPCAPEKTLFHQGSELLIPKMIEVFFQSLEQEPRKMAIAGLGDGVLSAQKIQSSFPQLFSKLSTFQDYAELTDEQIKSTWDYTRE